MSKGYIIIDDVKEALGVLPDSYKALGVSPDDYKAMLLVALKRHKGKK